jgi:hypothetical protein
MAPWSLIQDFWAEGLDICRHSLCWDVYMLMVSWLIALVLQMHELSTPSSSSHTVLSNAWFCPHIHIYTRGSALWYDVYKQWWHHCHACVKGLGSNSFPEVHSSMGAHLFCSWNPRQTHVAIALTFNPFVVWIAWICCQCYVCVHDLSQLPQANFFWSPEQGW